jgi:ketosteroid isomerase-like protein
MEHAEHARDDAIDHVLDAIDDAIDAFVSGRPEAFLRWWTRSEEVSLAGGLGGPIVRGQDAVRSRLARVSAGYGNAAFTSERVHVCAGRDVAYVVQHERIRVNPARGAAASASPAIGDRSYRVTMTLRREHDGWRVTHRHADPHLRDRTA